ncbi:MAG: VPLPA-CTERM sorting domain-containing protein [Methylohalobius sp.]|nr:VPLPA-CTERM sorting domain-containing protein [Methylohalobius sp.]
MRTMSKHMAVLALWAFSQTAVQAALSEYQGSASLTYTLSSVSGGDPSLLAVTLDFESDVANSYKSLSGDGQVTVSYPYPPPPPIEFEVGQSATALFSARGEVNNGEVTAQHVGLFRLALANTSSADTYQVSFGLDFSLSASATGQGAESQVSLEYFLEDPNTKYIQAYAHYLVGPNDLISDGDTWLLTLAPGEERVLTAQAGIYGNLQAVPLPAAAWLFLTAGAAILGLARRVRQIP